MIRAGTGLSEVRASVTAAREATSRALSAAGIERADAAFVFATSAHAARCPEIVAAVEETAGTNEIAGCSAAGVLTQDREIEAGPAVAVLVAAGPGLSVEVGLLPEAPPARDLGLALGKIARFPKAEGAAHAPPSRGVRRQALIMLFPASGAFDAQSFFAGLEAASGFLPVVGAASSSRGGEAVQFAAGKAGEERTATALVRAGAHVEVALTQGCRPIGRPAVITRADGLSTILGLAGRPPVEVLAEALEAAGVREEDAARAGILAGIAVDPRKHPLARGDFIVRPITGIDSTTGAISIGERVTVGQTLVFQLRDRETAMEDLEATLAELDRRLSGRAPRFGLYFDCLGRGSGLYGEPNHDVNCIRRRFPELPVAGLFGQGEIAPLAQKNHLHTYSGVLAVFCDP